MIKYEITDEWRDIAHRKYTGKKYNSTTIAAGGQGQIAGAIGELAFKKWLRDQGHDFDYVADDCLDYDFLVAGSHKVDVKTKNTHGQPKNGYMVRVPYTQAAQKTDTYVFTFTNGSDIWLLGWADKKDWWEGKKTFEAKPGDIVDKVREKVRCRYSFIGDLVPLDYLELCFVAV